MPAPRKPRETVRRRNAPDTWVYLDPTCSEPIPRWPLGTATPGERAMWKRLWRNPVANYWHHQRIEPAVVARYVRLAIEQPAHASVRGLEADLGLTPRGLRDLRLVVEAPVVEAAPAGSRYSHLKLADE